MISYMWIIAWLSSLEYLWIGLGPSWHITFNWGRVGLGPSWPVSHQMDAHVRIYYYATPRVYIWVYFGVRNQHFLMYRYCWIWYEMKIYNVTSFKTHSLSLNYLWQGFHLPIHDHGSAVKCSLQPSMNDISECFRRQNSRSPRRTFPNASRTWRHASFTSVDKIHFLAQMYNVSYIYQCFQPFWNHCKLLHGLQCENCGYIIHIWAISAHYLVFPSKSIWGVPIKP